MQGNGHKNVNWTQEKNALTQWKLQQRDGKFFKEPIRLKNTLGEVKTYTSGNQHKTDWM